MHIVSVLYMCSFEMLKDVGVEVPKSVETKKHQCSKTGGDGMQQ